MCLGVPGRIMEVYVRDGLNMAKVDFGGIFRETCLSYVPQAKVGDYCMIHVGFAISLLSESQARETFDLLREIGDLEQGLGSGTPE